MKKILSLVIASLCLIGSSAQARCVNNYKSVFIKPGSARAVDVSLNRIAKKGWKLFTVKTLKRGRLLAIFHYYKCGTRNRLNYRSGNQP